MKKQLYFLLVFSTIAPLYLHGVDTLLQDSGYARVKQEVDLLREKAFIRASRRAAGGAVIGAGIGSGSMFVAGPERRMRMQGWLQDEEYMDDESKKFTYGVGTLGGALAGAIAGAGMSEVQRRYTIWKINRALRTNTAYDFTKMRIHEAVMVLAAYQRDLLTMQVVMPHVQKFLKKRGVWEALTKLYFGVSSPDHIHRLKEVLELAQ